MTGHLSKSPLQESVLHVRCDFSALVHGSPGQVVPLLTEALVEVGLVYERPLFRAVAPQPLKDGKGAILLPPPEERRCGERFRSADNHRVVQVFSDGVAISWLKPYDSWETFMGFAFSVWDSLMKHSANDVRVDRIGLRAINRIPLPEGGDPIANVMVGRDLLPTLGGLRREGFLACDTFFDAATGARANVSRTFEPIQDAKGVSLVFDIDAFYLPRRVMKRDEVLGDIEQLHVLRNRIFFAEISEQTQEVFK